MNKKIVLAQRVQDILARENTFYDLNEALVQLSIENKKVIDLKYRLLDAELRLKHAELRLKVQKS
jgi:hypothetical protein